MRYPARSWCYVHCSCSSPHSCIAFRVELAGWATTRDRTRSCGRKTDPQTSDLLDAYPLRGTPQYHCPFAGRRTPRQVVNAASSTYRSCRIVVLDSSWRNDLGASNRRRFTSLHPRVPPARVLTTSDGLDGSGHTCSCDRRLCSDELLARHGRECSGRIDLDGLGMGFCSPPVGCWPRRCDCASCDCDDRDCPSSSLRRSIRQINRYCGRGGNGHRICIRRLLFHDPVTNSRTDLPATTKSI